MNKFDGFIPITDIRRKLYQKENQFNGFRDITDEKMAEIIRLRDIIKTACEERQMPKKGASKVCPDGLDTYTAFLHYVTNPQIHTVLPTFDERVLLLILGSDPELQTFYKFLTVPATEIQVKQNGTTETKRYVDEDIYSSEVRDAIGFYDPKLRFFEEAYFKKYVSKNQLVKESKRARMNHLLERASKITDFDSISDIRFEELKAMAEQWHIEFEGADYKTISYHIGVQYDYFRLATTTEQELMLILLLDPDMKALTIAEEECQIKKAAKRCKEAFGFYSQTFLQLERKYKQRFYPDVKLTSWEI